MSKTSTAQSLPDPSDIDLARASAGALGQLLANNPNTPRAHVHLDGEDLILPREALMLLREILTQMAKGTGVAVIPKHVELTTQEAANFLNVSRPYLVKLLDKGEIPCKKVGSHRRVSFDDVMQYKAKQDEQSQDALDALAAQAQDQDMGY